MSADTVLFRASFNFTSKCNLSCRFCYIPFDHHPVEDGVSERVVTRLADLGAKSITFGGGDPLKHRLIVELLSHARTAGISHIQVDTNALGWASRGLLEQVAGAVDMVGLPLDGPTPEAHEAMRSHSRSWADSVSAAVFLRSRADVKINTLVGAPNVELLRDMAPLVAQLSPRIWSIYEFWAIGPIARQNASDFALEPEQFASAIREVRAILARSGVEVEAGSIDDRSPSYFLVTDSGSAYAVNPSNRSQYMALGSVFDDEVLERWITIADAEKNWARTAKRFGMQR